MLTTKDDGVTILGTVGDVNPVEYGGGYIVQEGDDEPRIEYFHGLDTDEPDEDGKFKVYYATVEADVFDWCNWVSLDDQERFAKGVGVSIEEYRLQARSSNVAERARIIEDIAGHWGWYTLDNYPALFTEAELRARWDCPE
jgi:hypothetical protein